MPSHLDQYKAKKQKEAKQTPPPIELKHFAGFDFSDFWDDSAYALQNCVGEYPDDELIGSVEKELGYKLPDSYIEFIKLHNGGAPKKNCFPTNEPTNWAEDHIAVTTIFGVTRNKLYAINGELGSAFMQEEWGYPNIGVYIADTPTAGHEMIALDYRKCGANGEPEVVYVDQEADYKIIFLAKDFESFIKGLVSEEAYNDDERDEQDELQKVREGSFSPILLKAFEIAKPILPDVDRRLRVLAEKIVKAKGFFALHDDELSYLMYDILFWLYSGFNTAASL
ncbi:MAG: SMI1/KNR4 family protein, partial [Helicobacteraceae bacterium]|nr:SMI1/KNR4 family protein [Helicobacteraceae bacterium]